MSILPLSFAAGLAIDMFSTDVVVEDVVYETVDGIDRRVPVAYRTIWAAVDTGGKRTLEPIFGGSVSDGDLAIWPEQGTDLYFPDLFIQYPETDDQIRKQSFVTYRGIKYRVIGVADYTDQGDVKVFHATRYVGQDEAQ